MRLITSTLLLSVLLLLSTEASRPFYRGIWNAWKQVYKKSYSSPREENLRMRIFHNNLQFIRWHNRQYFNGEVSYYVGLNGFADLTLKEFADTYLNLQQTSIDKELWDVQLLHESPSAPVPNHIDWRKKGYVTDIKDQGQCGSCWAFSATGSLEGQYKKKKGKLVSFSEQQLVDCSWSQGNEGCNGGLMSQAFRYWMRSGAESEKDYPYTAYDGSCKFNKSASITLVKKFVKVKEGDEGQLKLSVGQIGPVSVGIDASSTGFQFYKSGIYKDENCSPGSIDHGVLVVGYDQDKKGGKYWIVKNSWSTDWGNEGYIWMARDYHNMCGIASLASYPVL
nr:cathepsin L cysteine proteinase [Hymenolepis microstoma]